MTTVTAGQAGAAAGAETPFEQVYREHFGFVYSSLLRLGVPSPAADDAAQDVFITVHRQLPGFLGHSALRSWIFGIARRVAFRHRRSAQRRAHKAMALAAAPTPAPEGPAESFEQAQRDRLLLRALDDLDEDKRAALTLHVFEELPGPELAALLGINLDTAYSRIKAARRDLQRALVALGATDEPETLIAATRRATKPDPAARQRVAGLVALRLGDVAGATASATAGIIGGKGVLAAIAVGAAVTIGVGLDDLRGSAPPRPSQSTSARLTAVEDTARPSPPVPAELAPPVAKMPAAAVPPGIPPAAASPANTTTRRVAAPVAPAQTDALAAALAEEVALITAAKAALDAGDPKRALAQLDAHATRFADGQLATERAGYRAIALCAAGQRVAGRGQAKVFLARHGGVTLAPRIRDACGLIDGDPK